MKVFTLMCLVLIQIYQINCYYDETAAALQEKDTDFIMTIDPIVDFKLNISDECQKMGICENIPGYPEDAVNEIIKNLKLNEIPFNKDKLIVQADLNHVHDQQLCKSKQKMITPKAAVNKAGEWYLVLNMVNNPVQQFYGEICFESNASCNEIAYFHMGYKGDCFQKFIMREMIVLNQNMDKVMKRHLKVPSCCSCVGIRT